MKQKTENIHIDVADFLIVLLNNDTRYFWDVT
jgi:hypothetical protein